MISLDTLGDILPVLPLELGSHGWMVQEQNFPSNLHNYNQSWDWYRLHTTAHFELESTVGEIPLRAHVAFNFDHHERRLHHLTVEVREIESGDFQGERVEIPPRASWRPALLLDALERARQTLLQGRWRQGPEDHRWEELWRKESSVDELLRLAQGRIAARKLRLFACACVRRVWDVLNNRRSHRFVDAVEQYYFGQTNEADVCYHEKKALAVAGRASIQSYSSPQQHAAQAAAYILNHVSRAATHAAHAFARRAAIRGEPQWPHAGLRERKVQTEMLRDVVGDPLAQPAIPRSCLAWRNGIIPAMARSILEERSFEQLPILADALEDAGCEDVSILSHCREPGMHVVGCWVLDRVVEEKF